jgi:hypothetical protein
VGQQNEQRFVVGDLVTGQYEMHSYYSYFYDDFKPFVFIGLVTHISVEAHDMLTLSDLFYGPYFEVLCTDGISRFFTECELVKIS